MPGSTFDLLEKIMGGEEITPNEIDAFVSQKTPEDLHLEYKHGDELKIAKKANHTMRQYLSGFANSAGGVLVIGVDETNWQVTGCESPTGHDLHVWASDALKPLAAHFSPPPRFQIVKHTNGNILLAAVYRSASLVPCVEAGRISYFLRLHDKTLEAPEYLLSDLLLGRRQHPRLQITECRFATVRSTI